MTTYCVAVPWVLGSTVVFLRELIQVQLPSPAGFSTLKPRNQDCLGLTILRDVDKTIYLLPIFRIFCEIIIFCQN
jgi:hypothetical protein